MAGVHELWISGGSAARSGSATSREPGHDHHQRAPRADGTGLRRSSRRWRSLSERVVRRSGRPTARLPPAPPQWLLGQPPRDPRPRTSRHPTRASLASLPRPVGGLARGRSHFRCSWPFHRPGDDRSRRARYSGVPQRGHHPLRRAAASCSYQASGDLRHCFCAHGRRLRCPTEGCRHAYPLGGRPFVDRRRFRAGHADV